MAHMKGAIWLAWLRQFLVRRVARWEFKESAEIPVDCMVFGSFPK